MNALIGHTGFVGGNLLACRDYDDHFRSTDIERIRDREFDHLVCAGVQAMKWWANLHPEEDMRGIGRLLSPLRDVKARRVTLISTVDVYPAPNRVDEETPITSEGHHPYGLHRLEVERRIRSMFPRVLVIRLPGLFGPGLKKNVIHDLIHDHNLDKVHEGGVFQYYDLRRLADDIDRAWSLAIPLLNIGTAPLATAEIRDRFFPGKTLCSEGPAPAPYDMRSIHAGEWAGADGYLYSKRRVIADLGDWLESLES